MTNAGAQPLAKLSKGLPTTMIKIPKDLLSKNVLIEMLWYALKSSTFCKNTYRR